MSYFSCAKALLWLPLIVRCRFLLFSREPRRFVHKPKFIALLFSSLSFWIATWWCSIAELVYNVISKKVSYLTMGACRIKFRVSSSKICFRVRHLFNTNPSGRVGREPQQSKRKVRRKPCLFLVARCVSLPSQCNAHRKFVVRLWQGYQSQVHFPEFLSDGNLRTCRA